jgi:flagellar hook-basal body complex protein FliE
MSFDAMSGISGVAGLGAQGFGVGGTRGVAASGYLPSVSAADSVQDVGGATFASSLTGAVDGLTAMQSESKGLAVQALTGDLSDIHNATIASSRAQITLELVAAVRNKGVDAFNEIMRMQA